MRPRLNLSLRRALMTAMATACTLLSTTAWGGVMHDDVSFQTYTDFGQNRGRYVVGSQVNELLSYIRSEVDKGIVIHYQAGGSYTISNEQGMINFGGTHDQGHSAVISPTFIATVFHNGSLNASVGERWVGESHAINYDGVDIRGSNVFRLAPDNGNGVEYDYMIQRQSKIVTDATWNTLTTLTSTEINNLDGSYIYHSGSGTQYVWLEEEERMKSLCGAYQYIIGAINTITNGQIHGNTTNLSLHQQPDYSNGGDADTNTKNPLPNGIRAGDSGSPTYIYNTKTGQYEYIAAQQSGGGSSYGQARGNVEWTNTTLELFNARVDLSATNTVYLNAIDTTDAEADHIVDNLGNSTQIYHGVATDADGNEIASYRGIQSGVNTWGDLSGIKNNDTWYTYGSSYLKQKDADLFFNDNLVFTATNGNEYSIVLNDTVDLGVGYVEFNKGEGDWEKAIFTITSAEGENNRLNSAGFVINEDAEVHLRVNNPDTHMTEWRKNGAGNLYIDGTGATNALLTVGGSGTTYLQQTGGYAAYNVLASSGATVVIKDLAQIERDFTFGVGGGVLDMNGNSMDWYTSTDGEGRFTIHALTEEAIITNSSSTAVNLTYKEAGNQTFKGSFVTDSGKTLKITYDGGGTWTLNSIHTRLSTNSSSSFTVNNGTVIFKGTNTVHGLGSTNGLPSGGRLNNPNDWHYADATMDVTVANGATFELGSHARLTGTVNVEDGGTFVLREGVKHRYEYVEGGAVKEDTYDYAQFYGLHNTTDEDGVYLKGSDASMQVAFSEGTTANTTIAAKLSGTGSISVAAGTAGGSLTLSGDNSGLSGTKTLISGGLIADTNKSLGDTTTNRWVVNQEAWIASHEFESADNIFTHIDASSTGTLALSKDIKSQLSQLSGTHKNMTLGAEVGKTVNYGTLGTSETLTAVDGVWKLGGGGGELVVNFVLAGNNTLMLGNHAAAQGTVTLTNNNAGFSGDIIFSGTGITLKATNDSAFGSAKVALDYGNVLALGSVSNYGLIKDGSTGVLALASSQDVDLSAHAVTLGALGEVEYEGSLSATKDGSYRIGGSGHLIFTNQNTFSASNQMYIDGQGLSGSAVTFARANAYTGNIVAGGGLQLDSTNSSGDVTIHLGHRDSLASASSVLLQKGASLQFDALATAIVQNLSVQSGASLVNNGFDDTTVTLNVTDTHRSSIVSSALSGNKIHLVKTGSGTLYMSSTQSESWTGGLTIKEGTVEADIHSSGWTNFGGVGSSSNVVAVEKGATLKLNAEARYGYNLAGTALPQMVVGSGTIELSSGGAVVYGNSKFDFDGTIKISGGTRLYVGSKLQMNNRQITYNNLAAVNGTTVEIEAGSQVRVTSSLQYLTDEKVTTSADFIINGQGYTGKDSSQHKEGYTNNGLYQADLHGGALSLDAASTVTGNITLATDAAIASWSDGNLVTSTVAAQSVQGAVPYACHTNSSYRSYRLKGHLGGTVRGLILGVEEADGSMSDLTLVGNETLTFTADSANTYGDLLVAMDGNGNEDDKVALKLDGGSSLSQTSTALGTGSVTLNDGLILRLAGTGVENNSDVVYTYENNMSVGVGATLQSYNITNRLTGTVTMTGETSTLNLATARGGVLELAGGISGSGTLNVAAGSKVILGSASAGSALARTGPPPFSGTVAAGDGADITLASPAVVAADTAFTGTDNLTLRFSGTEDFTLGSISMTGETSTLNLNFDFSAVPDEADATPWSTLTVKKGITADSTTIGLTLNVDNDIASGSYALISGVSSTEGYSLADTLSGRLRLAIEDGNLVLVVDADGRLYWRSSGENWNTTEAHWYKQVLGDTLTTFSSEADVVFDVSGVAQDNSAATPEQVVLNESVSVGKMSVKDAAYTISGTGAIAGQSLVVSGGAEAILNLSAEAGSSFTAGVTIDDATLTLQGTSLAAAATVQNRGTLALNSAAKLTGNVIVESGARFTADNATLTGNLSVREADAALSNASTVSGNVTVREGKITIDGSRVTGSFSGEGKGSAVLTNATLTTTDGWVFSELKNKFSLNAAASGTISWDVANGYLTLDSLTTTGNLSTTNDATAAGEMVFLGTSSIGRLEGKMGTLTIGLDADHTAFLTVTSAEFSDNDNKGAVTLNINEGSTFKVTSTGTQGSDTYNNDGIRIGEWNSATTVNVDGALLAANSSLHVGDRTSYVNIGSTGVLAVKGIRNGRTDRTTGVVLTMEAGGKLIVGSENVATKGAFTATLNGGTIASSADATTIKGAFTANGSLEIDTNRYDFATDGNSIARGTAASTITMQGSLSGECALTVSGFGKLALQNDGSAFTGSIALKDTATLSVNSTSAGILSGVSSLAVNSGTLDLSELDFNTETQPTIALSAEASFSFTENSTVAFGTMHEDTWYSVFDTNAYGAALDGWENLSVSNFAINGVSMADMGRITLTTVEAGGLFYYTIDRYDLVWTGGESGTWNNTDVKWQTTRPNEETGEPETFSTAFVNNDNVTFNSSASLQVADGVIVNNVTIEGNSTVTLDGAALTADKVTIESGSTLKGAYDSVLVPVKAFDIAAGATLEMNVSGSPTYTAEVSGDGAVTMTGGGTLTWNPTDGTLDIGTLNITGGGTFKTASDFSANTLNVANGSAQFNKVATTNQLTATNGTLNGSGELTVNGTTTATTLTVSAGTASFKGDTTITTANFNGGTVNFATENLSIGTFKRNAGNINFKLAEGKDSTTYSVGAITGSNAGIMSIDQGVTVNATSIANNSWYAGGSRTLDVDGVLNISQNMTLHMDGRGERFQGSGVINVGGNANLTVWGNVNMGVGELNVTGNLSVGAYWGQTNFNINDGVVSVGGVFNNSSDSNVVNLNICGGSLVLKGSSEMKKDTLNISAGSLVQAGGSSTISNTVSMSGGELRVSGGVMNITSTAVSATGGSIAVSGGELVLGAEAADALLGGADTVSLTGGVLDVGGVTFSASGGIALGGTMSVSGGMIELGSSMTATNTDYAIFDLTAAGASLDNWENMKSNISVGGVSLLRYEGATLSLTDDAASLSFTSLEKSTFDDLQWSGGASGTWDCATANWDRTGDDADTLYSFANGDSVSFNTDAAVTLSQAITANNVTIADGTTVSLNESSGKLSATSISVGEGAKLSFDTKTTAVSTTIGSNITGSGTVVLNLCNSDTSHWGNKITMGNGFTGEVHLNAGRMTLDGSATGSKLVLLTDAADIQLTTTKNSATSWSGNLELRGTHEMHSNSNTNFTFTGNVTGTGTYAKQSTGKLTFGASGTVNLGQFTQTGGETIFAGATTLNGLSATGGTVSFGGATSTLTGTASATTLNLTGGTMKVNYISDTTGSESGSFMATTLNYTGGSLTMSGTVNITTLKVGDGLTAKVYNGTGNGDVNKTFGTVELGQNAVLKAYNRAQQSRYISLGSVKLMDSDSKATLTDDYWSGYYRIGSLNVAEGVSNAELEFKKESGVEVSTVYELGAGTAESAAGNFSGTLTLNEANTSSNHRTLAVILSHKNIAQNALISFADVKSSKDTSCSILGVNVDSTTIAGLESLQTDGSQAKVLSGTIAANSNLKDGLPNTVGDAVRTLNITTKAGGEHAFYGEVLGSLNLVIDGEGTQKFLGTSNSFNGTVTVQGGTAAFNAAGTSLLEHATAFTLSNEGVLDLSAITFGTDSTNAIALASGATYSFSDGVIDLGNLDADTTYQIFDTTTNGGSLSGWDTLDLANFRINGSLLADADGFVDISLGADGTFFYTMTNPEENPLYWNGGASGTWNTTDAKWGATPDVADDGLVAFRDKSAVVFASSATVNITDEVEAYSVIITDGAEVKLTMGANGGLATGEVVVDAGTLELGSEKNWQHLSYVTVGEEGVLRLMYGVGINNTQDATDIFLNGGKIELRNGAGANQVLHADMVVDGSGTIAGSRNGDGTTISGTISGNGTLTFEADSGHNNWITVSSDISDGEEGVLALHVKNAQIKLTSAANTYTGDTTIDAGGKLVLDLGTTTNDAGDTVNRTYTLGGTVSGEGTLEVAAGTTLKVANDKTISSALLVNGGVVDVTANNNKVMAGNITVQNGGELKFTYSGGSEQYDCFAFVGANTARTITLDNGTLDLGAMRHTMQNWSITMSNGSLLKGTGSSYTINGKSYTAALDVATNNMTISSTSGDNEISAVTRLRTNTLKYNVTGGTLTISGEIMSDDSNPAIVKEGSGDLIFTRDHTFAGTTTISAGKLVLDLGTVTTGEGENAVTTNGIYTLDGAVSGDGTLQVMGGTTVEADAAAETISTAVILEKGSVLKLANGTTNTLSKDVTKGTSGAGVLQVESNTTLANNGKVISADLVLNGGNATVNGNKTISGDITINSGSVLTAGGTSDDTLVYADENGDYTRTLTINAGGTLAMGSRRWSMGNESNGKTESVYDIVLNGGKITGNGTVTDGTATGNLDFFKNGKISATGTTGEISAEIRVRNDNNKLALTVTGTDAKLEVSGNIVGNGGISKSGAGKLVLSGANTYADDTQITAGTLELQGAGKLGAGDVSIAAGGAALTAATTATQDAESEEWARIMSTSDTAAATVSGATITQTEGEKALSIASRSTDGTRGTMANTLVQIAQGASVTVENMVIGSSSSLRGQAQVAYAARSVEAAQASINNSTIELSADNDSIVGTTQAMTLTQLQPIGTSDTTGTLTLSGSSNVLTVTSFALSDLVLTSGTNFVVDFSSLLSWESLADVDFVALSFNNVSYADLANTTIGGLLAPSTNLTAYYDSTVNAPVPSIYFDVRAIPEPTSTTLSILALAALAARRRRK